MSLSRITALCIGSPRVLLVILQGGSREASPLGTWGPLGGYLCRVVRRVDSIFSIRGFRFMCIIRLVRLRRSGRKA